MNYSITQLTPEQRIAQVLHVASWSNKGPEHEEHILTLIREYGIGGIIFFQGDPVSQALLTNRYQAASRVPLLISIDAEWGLGMRLDESMSFPRQMALGAIADEQLIYEMGAEIGRQCQRLGIHVNFAPVVDINTEPKNPVIGLRSFGEDKIEVSKRAIAYMKGMQEQQVLAVAKHFPGHGDTSTDSHFTLPVLKHDRERLESIELYPFGELFAAGVGGVMVGHIHVPDLDPTPNLASTLSRPIVTGLLREEMGYQGLVFTDALDMKGVSKFYAPGRVDALALLAGNDVLLYAEDVAAAISAILEAVEKGEISQEEIDRRVLKQLAVKTWAGLKAYQPIVTEDLLTDLHSSHALALNRQLTEASMTLVRNDEDFLPVKPGERVAAVSIFSDSPTPVQLKLEEAGIDLFGLDPSEDPMVFASKLQSYDKVIVSLHGINVKAANNFDITAERVKALEALLTSYPSGLLLFGSPYALHHLPGYTHARSLLVAYEETELAQHAAADVVLGILNPIGHLPVTVQSPDLSKGAGITFSA